MKKAGKERRTPFRPAIHPQISMCIIYAPTRYLAGK